MLSDHPTSSATTDAVPLFAYWDYLRSPVRDQDFVRNFYKSDKTSNLLSSPELASSSLHFCYDYDAYPSPSTTTYGSGSDSSNSQQLLEYSAEDAVKSDELLVCQSLLLISPSPYPSPRQFSPSTPRFSPIVLQTHSPITPTRALLSPANFYFTPAAQDTDPVVRTSSFSPPQAQDSSSAPSTPFVDRLVQASSEPVSPLTPLSSNASRWPSRSPSSSPSARPAQKKMASSPVRSAASLRHAPPTFSAADYVLEYSYPTRLRARVSKTSTDGARNARSSPVPAPAAHSASRRRDMEALSSSTKKRRAPDSTGLSGRPRKQPRLSSAQESSAEDYPDRSQDSTGSSANDPATRANYNLLPCIRVFPDTIPIRDDFPLFYRRFPASSIVGPDKDHRPKEGTANDPRDALDLYTPRFVKGIGRMKEGLCPICWEPPARGGEGRKLWLQTKVSAYNYHMQYYHGLSAVTGRPFSPPIAFRTAARPTAPAHCRKSVEEGRCHACTRWVVLETVKDVETKVRERVWWKHAATCHGRARIAGEEGDFVEDAVWAEAARAVELQRQRRQEAEDEAEIESEEEAAVECALEG